MSAPNLRLVHRRAPRPSVIEDMSTGRPPVMQCPWTIAQMDHANDHGPIPQSVISGMYVAAWARAEHCPLNIVAGRLEPHCRYNPSEILWANVAQAMGEIIGVLGFGVPILRDDKERAWAASWRFSAHGRN